MMPSNIHEELQNQPKPLPVKSLCSDHDERLGKLESCRFDDKIETAKIQAKLDILLLEKKIDPRVVDARFEHINPHKPEITEVHEEARIKEGITIKGFFSAKTLKNFGNMVKWFLIFLVAVATGGVAVNWIQGLI